MVMVYVRLIEMKSRTIDTVPSNLRDAVAAELAKRGVDGEGNPIVPDREDV